MKILVGVKRVIDYAVKVRIMGDKTGVDLNNVKMAMNPFCEIATEEAIRLKEKKVATETIALSIGPKGCQETLRTALAMGVDRAIHVQSDLRIDQELHSLSIAKIFQAVAKKENVELILLGKQAIDSDNGQAGQILSALLSWPHCTFASKIEIDSVTKVATVDRETDYGSEKISMKLPGIITADLRLNEPRYATLPNIMKAKKKSIEALTLEGLGIKLDESMQNQVLKVEDPEARKGGVIVENVDVLIDKLRNEAKII